MKITVTRRKTFEAAHKLKAAYMKDCHQNIHGHSYKLLVSLTSEVVDENEMVVDFKLLDEIIEEAIIQKYDHCLILHKDDPLKDSVIGKVEKLKLWNYNPTAEYMAKQFYRILENEIFHRFNDKFFDLEITLYETEDSWVTIRKNE